MKVIIVGGGISGLTLAASLNKHNIDCIIIEKTAKYGGVGGVLSLWPMGNRLLKNLDLFEDFLDASEPLRNYTILNHKSKIIRNFDLTQINDQSTGIHDLMRYSLIDILRKGCSGVEFRMNCTINKVFNTNDGVSADLTDGTTVSGDVLIGADGINSITRKLVFGEHQKRYTGWKGYGWPISPKTSDLNTVFEYWLHKRFIGVYPGKDGVFAFTCLPDTNENKDPIQGRGEKILSNFHDVPGIAKRILEQIPEDPQIWHDSISDLWIDNWVKNRIVLIGDASAAILPTAGIGASVAMESAVELSQYLRRSEGSIHDKLSDFYHNRKEKVYSILKESGDFAKIMFTKSLFLSKIRNGILRFMPTRMMFKQIQSHQ